MIAKETIDKVFDASRVEEVIGDFVQLKRSGSNYKGLSPFSDERTPSFMVSPVKQIWKDFSSGKGGNVVAFLMEHEHYTYPEAIKYLAKKYGIEVEETEQTNEEKEKSSERESMYLVSEFAQSYFQKTLKNSELGKAIGGTYFKERGFTKETIDKFKLGYSLDQWDAFTKEALGAGYQLEYLEKTGLTIVKEKEGSDDKRMFDRFKGRVMFPIHSMSGRVLGFGGRILTSDKKAAKYLNSPESDIYHKSKVLYGIYHAKQAIAKQDNCFLVEGYTDVIQFHQSGIENVVASSGTALTPDQIRLINRLTKNITVLFDGDAAGLRASLRGIDLILEQGMNVKVCTFPEGQDPDSYARANSEEDLVSFLEENATDFIRFKASLLVKDAQNDPIKKADTIREIVNSIFKIPDRIQREIYVQECSRIMDISEDVLYNTLAQLGNKEVADANKKHKEERKKNNFNVVRPGEGTSSKKVNQLNELEKSIIGILLFHGDKTETFNDIVLEDDDNGDMIQKEIKVDMKVYEKIFLDLQADEIEFANKDFHAIYTILIEMFNVEGVLKMDSFLQKLTFEQNASVVDILMNEEKYALSNWESKDILVKDKSMSVHLLVFQTISMLRLKLLNMLVDSIHEVIGANNNATTEQLEDIKNYWDLRKTLSDRFGLVTNTTFYS
ncbi:DNA primase, catalytic core [Galbibacter orientalis DSM 19592]|uniref:DNA primase n=1 Tax=Galbibacter orientalis DSM 19592 TaxID=926559 RepID=I3C5X2_9FLAO|nr:DNA primase [Galbibacter orientalis]EIJ39015.1 DNA primase, catalytic core [Galbibacter orientalis DSM 19592]